MAGEAALDGKVVVVTGAGRGIGREIALLAAAEGAKVVVNDLGGAADGDGASAAPAEMSVVDFELVVKVHLLGSFYVSHAAARLFREQGSGAFVHFTSTSGLIGNFGQANYAAAKLGIVGLSKSIALDMARFGVRSNCVSPFAWSRLIGTIPTQTEAEKARVQRLQAMGPEKIAPLSVFLLADAAKDVTGQIFAVRMNEIFLMGQSRPLRSVHRSEGWTCRSLAEHAMPALKGSFYPLDRSADIFSWDAV